MRKEILVILGILIILGFVFSFGYWLVYKYTLQEEQEELTEIPTLEESEAKSVQRVTFLGEVKEIFENSLIVITDNGDSEILINEETEFFLPLAVQKETTEQESEIEGVGSVEAEIVELKDIKIGDKVNISAEKENEILTGIIIVILR